MAITKAEILVVVNTRLARAETNIDEEIRSALYDISSRGNFLLTKTNSNTADGDVDYAFPTGAKQILWIKLTAGKDGKPTDPLTKIDFATYLLYRGDEGTGENEDEPEYYAIHNETIYPYPVPDATYQMQIYHSYYHTNDVNTIAFGEQFREAIYEGTMVKVCEKFQLWDDAKAHLTLLESEIAKRLDNVEKPPSVTKHRDI